MIKHDHNHSLETAQVINELIELAKQMKAAHQRGQALGNEMLRRIAPELVETVTPQRHEQLECTRQSSLNGAARFAPTWLSTR